MGVDTTAARAAALGIGARLGQKFECVLAGCDGEAVLHPTQAGHWRYRCDCLVEGGGLAEIRAFVAYGDRRPVPKVQCARWSERLSYEAGLLVPRPVPPLPDTLSANARRVGEGWRLLVGLRSRDHFDAAVPFVFGREFVIAWCGVSDEQARRGVVELERAGVMHRVGKHRRTILWQPGEAPASRRRLIDEVGSEDAVVEAIRVAFDAVEVAA